MSGQAADAYVFCPSCLDLLQVEAPGSAAVLQCACGTLFALPEQTAAGAAETSESEAIVHRPGGQPIRCPGLVVLADWLTRGLINASDRVTVSGQNPLPLGLHAGTCDLVGAMGTSARKTIAFAYLPPDLATVGTNVEIEYLGTRYPATVANDPQYDPEGKRLKA